MYKEEIICLRRNTEPYKCLISINPGKAKTSGTRKSVGTGEQIDSSGPGLSLFSCSGLNTCPVSRELRGDIFI
jgi:hypothetical protein